MELLIAKTLSKEKPIDAVISHHPSGQGLARCMKSCPCKPSCAHGIPINIAESLLELRISEVARISNNKTGCGAQLEYAVYVFAR